MKKIISILTVLFTVITAVYSQNQIDSLVQEKMIKLAMAYRLGVHKPVCPDSAVLIYKRLVVENNYKAMYELGRMYFMGDGVEKDYKKAFDLFRKSSKHIEKSAIMCAYMFQKGIGKKQDYYEAYRWYWFARRLGYAYGYYGIGYLSYKGLGTPQDYNVAEENLLIAAEKGVEGAHFLLGNMYLNGYLGTADLEKAKKHYDAATMLGHGWTVDIVKEDIFTKKQEFRKSKNKNTILNHEVFKHGKPRVRPSEKDIENGRWKGVQLTYDWSRKHLLDEKPVECLIEGNDTAKIISYFLNDSLVCVSKLRMKGKYYCADSINLNNQKSSWEMIQASFNRLDDKLLLHLKSINYKTRELMPPIVVVLHNSDTQESVFLNDSLVDINEIERNANGNLMITINSKEKTKGVISIMPISSQGNVETKNMMLTKGLNKYHSLKKYSAGIFTISVSTEQGTISKNVILQ